MTLRSRTIGLTVTAAGALTLLTLGARAQSPTQAQMYRLVEIGGQPLPVVVEQEGECREEIRGGTLTLETAGTWTLVLEERDVCGDQVDDSEDREQGRYAVEGQTVRFLNDNGEPRSFDADDDEEGEIEVDEITEGRRADDGLTGRLPGGTVVLFRP